MRKPGFKKPRKLEEQMLSTLPPKLSQDVRAVIEEIIRNYVNPWQMWAILTDIRNRIDALTAEDEARLLQFGVVRPIDEAIVFDPEDPREIRAILVKLGAPHAEVREAILEAFPPDLDDVAENACELGTISPETARALLSGRIATARRLWAAVSPDDRARLSGDFGAITADVLVYHLIDSLWQAGEDTARRHFAPTGSAAIDGDGSKETKLGSIDARIRELGVAIGVLDRIAKIRDEKKQKEALELVFAPILGLAGTWMAQLERQHGAALGSLLKTWDQTGRAVALDAVARIRDAIEEERQRAGPGKRGAVGRRDYKTYIGDVDEMVYLGFQCAAWWTDASYRHVASRAPDDEPQPQPLRMRSDFKTLFVCVMTFAVDSSRHARKHIAGKLASTDKQAGRLASLAVLLERIDSDFDVYVTDLGKPAEALWNRKFANDWERRCFETECYGRFWLRLHL